MTDIKFLAHAGHRKLEEKLAEYVYPQLKNEPHFGQNIKRLINFDPATWRYRVGTWRFFYIIDEEMKVVSMVAASHRKEAYR